jgi:hypothetical protein
LANALAFLALAGVDKRIVTRLPWPAAAVLFGAVLGLL